MSLALGIAAAFGSFVLLIQLLLPQGRPGRLLQTAVHASDGIRARVDLRGALESIRSRLPAERPLSERIELAGWTMRTSEFTALQAGAGAAGLVAGLTLAGSAFLALLACVTAAAAPRIVLKRRVEHRAQAFSAQLPDTLQLMASSMEAGYGLLQAMDSVVRQALPPTSTEFGRVLTEVRLGAPLHEALDAMAERLSSDELRWVVVAVNIQREVGGNLSMLLKTVAETLRERAQLRRQVRVLSAEGRVSAVVLSLLPLAIGAFLAVVNPSYIGVLTSSPAGRTLLLGALGLMALGAAWMRSLVRIDV